ncbi:MAG: hypothetical protein JHD40_01310, partial [Acidimicrobiia bacterium]|nr:hypothetical protein [Acidimicrobiia bacterium]
AYLSRLAERYLRRPDQPGPAGEHVLQYLVSGTLDERRADDGSATKRRPDSADSSEPKKRKPVVVGQADFFYRAQYRSTCSPTMGAFAATARQVFATSSTEPRGHLWWRHRETVTAILPRHAEGQIRPILMLNDESVAVAVLVPRSGNAAVDSEIEAWLHDGAHIPAHLAESIRGEEQLSESGIAKTRARDHLGSVCELINAARQTGWLALLALHPFDPDAMGLHITLFGVESVSSDRLAQEYGLSDTDLAPHREQAQVENAILGYLVGGTAEVFTQCSQNLFVKQIANEPTDDLEDAIELNTGPVELATLFANQFESIQATVDASGLPGASPRNGQVGRAVLLGSRRGRTYILIPYHPGNAIHGHAAKLWSNRYASISVSDDHTLHRRVTIMGKSWVASHERITREFPAVSRSITHPDGGTEATVSDPVYWFVTRADTVTWERGALPAYILGEGREVCSINAGGEGRHTKKPKYFDTASLPTYDVAKQHHRESAGRATDREGKARALWLESLAPALAAREEHFESAGID